MGEPQAGGADLAAGRAEGAGETAAAGTAVAWGAGRNGVDGLVLGWAATHVDPFQSRPWVVTMPLNSWTIRFNGSVALIRSTVLATGTVD